MSTRWAVGTRAEVLAELGVAAVVHECRQCGATDHGRPLALDAAGRPLGLALSIAHAGDLVIGATSEAGPVGVDLEILDAKPPRAVVLHPSESGDALTAWVRKEAVLKATGLGLAIDPASFWIDEDGRPSPIAAWAGPPLVVADLDVEGHRAALAQQA